MLALALQDDHALLDYYRERLGHFDQERQEYMAKLHALQLSQGEQH